MFTLLVILGFIGMIVEKGSCGDKPNVRKSMVEAVEEHNTTQVVGEARKKKWALVLYSFSISRNFDEIFFRPYKTIRDKKFQIFDGLRVHMILWVMLGHLYLLGC